MNRAIAEKWVAALRSGKYKQTKGRLKSRLGNFCCLGVLCDLYREEKDTRKRKIYWKQPSIGVSQIFTVMEKGIERELADNILPQEVIQWAEMRTSDGTFRTHDRTHDCMRYCLAEMNDDGDSFKKIAKVIDKHWENL